MVQPGLSLPQTVPMFQLSINKGSFQLSLQFGQVQIPRRPHHTIGPIDLSYLAPNASVIGASPLEVGAGGVVYSAATWPTRLVGNYVGELP